MRRIVIPPRANMAEALAKLEFNFASMDGQPYWNEGACYAFSLAEIEEGLEDPAQELAAMCVDLVPKILADEKLMRRTGLPVHAWDKIAASWRAREPSLYGRFDFAFDGSGDAKMLEYNADTPTSLYESAIVQWFWLKDLVARGDFSPNADQFNSIHERLIERWRVVARGNFVHLACMRKSTEDSGTIAYLADCAAQAGRDVAIMDMGDIGMLGDGFVDRAGKRIETLFKLYPWEWMFADDFGSSPAMTNTQFVEPMWKALLSNKALLPLLWEAHEGHPNLLPTYFENDPRCADLAAYARKPILSREGANVSLFENNYLLERMGGDYGGEGYIRQALHKLPDFDGKHPVCGVWIVGDNAAGLGIRESKTLITSNLAQFIPHVILD